jgi:membrane-associated phospholipid phosphatase
MSRLTARAVLPSSLPALESDRPRLRATAPVPILEARKGGYAAWLETLVHRAYPFAASYTVANILSFLVVGIGVALGLLATRIVLPIGGLEQADARLPEWMESQRTSFWNDATYWMSQVGATVLIAVVAGTVIFFAFRRRWRIAGFLLTAILVEVTTYRLIAELVSRDRPDVVKLDNLNPAHSFPSGHVAASVAVYCGIALLLTSRFHQRWLRMVIWTVALSIPFLVAVSRIYRGEHHVVDVIGGALLGAGAVLVAVLATRVGIVADERRQARPAEGVGA